MIFKRKQIGPQRVAANIIARAIDGVDDPAAPVARLHQRAFFTQHTIVGKMAGQQSGDGALAFAVGHGHGRLVLFGVDGNSSLQAACDVSGGGHRVTGCGEFIVPGHRIHCVRFSFGWVLTVA